MQYRPEIDGLRTLAILPVILFHLQYSWIRGGYLGVDVFFVISGFLITTILTTKISDGNFSMLEFWTRRIKRLLPALLVVVLFFLIISPFIIFRPSVKNLSNDICPAIFSYFNFYASNNFSDYWGTSAEKSYFLHTWSLSVEEQFYFIYPLFLFFAYKYFKNYIVPLVIISITSITLYLYCLNSGHANWAFYLTPSRIWELGIGGVLSLINVRMFFKNDFTKNLMIFVGLIFLLSSYFIPILINNENGIGSIVAVSGTGIILTLCSQKDFLGKILSSKPFTYVGNLSYSLYLWHWPMIVLFGSLSFQTSNYNIHFINLVILILTLFFSIISYHFIENKTRKAKYTLKLVVFLILCVLSLMLYYRSDNFNSHYNSNYSQVKYSTAYYTISPTPTNLKSDKYKEMFYNVDVGNKKTLYKNAFKKEGIISIVNGRKPELMLLGDSHGVMWGNVLDEICDSLKISRSFYSSSGCLPFFNLKNINVQEGNTFFTQKERIDYAKSVVRNIEKWKPKIIIIACKWENLITEGKTKRQMSDLMKYLHSRSIKVILFNQPPVIKIIEDNNASQYFTFLGLEPIKGFNYLKITDEEKIIIGNKYLIDLKNDYDNLNIYDVYSNMKKNKKMIVSKDKKIFYFDDDHLSYEGTKFHKNNITKLVTVALKEDLTN